MTTNLGFPRVGEAIVVQPDGKILPGAQVLGADELLLNIFVLARYNSNGSLDATFGSDGTVPVVSIQGCTTVAVLSDGDIPALNGGAIAEFSSTGALESSVESGTMTAISQGGPVVFQADGKYVIANPSWWAQHGTRISNGGTICGSGGA